MGGGFGYIGLRPSVLVGALLGLFVPLYYGGLREFRAALDKEQKWRTYLRGDPRTYYSEDQRLYHHNDDKRPYSIS